MNSQIEYKILVTFSNVCSHYEPNSGQSVETVRAHSVLLEYKMYKEAEYAFVQLTTNHNIYGLYKEVTRLYPHEA